MEPNIASAFGGFHHPLLALLTILLNHVNVLGTTLVAARSSDEVVLAADSKFVHLNDRQVSDVKCKIIPCGSFYIGLAGPDGVNDVIDFRPRLLLQQACREDGDSETKMKRFEKILRPRYTQFIAGIGRFNPEYYRYGIQSRELFVNLVMVGFEDGMSFIRGINLSPPLDASAEFIADVRTSNQTRRLGLREIDYLTAGVHDDIDELAKTRKSLWRLGLVEAVKFLVTYEMVFKPAVVGPPVDVVRITKDGAQWLHKKPECEDPKKAKSKKATRRATPRRGN